MKEIVLTKKVILVTGAAGFIGSYLVRRLFHDEKEITIIGLDNMNNYYDVRLKEHRLVEIEKTVAAQGQTWVFIKGDIADKTTVDRLF